MQNSADDVVREGGVTESKHELGGVCHIPDKKVRLLVGFECAQAICTTERLRGFSCDTRERFFRCQTILAHTLDSCSASALVAPLTDNTPGQPGRNSRRILSGVERRI